MSAEDLEKYETEMELQLYREYRDVVGLFKYVIETERRFYLTNQYELHVRSADGEVFFELAMADAWVWDMYRPARFVNLVSGFAPAGILFCDADNIKLPFQMAFFYDLNGDPQMALSAIDHQKIRVRL